MPRKTVKTDSGDSKVKKIVDFLTIWSFRSILVVGIGLSISFAGYLVVTLLTLVFGGLAHVLY